MKLKGCRCYFVSVVTLVYGVIASATDKDNSLTSSTETTPAISVRIPISESTVRKIDWYFIRLLLFYGTPVYFFVAPDDDYLVVLIATGLTRLKESGELERFLNESFGLDSLYQELDFHNLRILRVPQR